MNSLSTITNPLMRPIQYEGQTYFTGQYFHQMYRNNSDTGGKYKRAGDFMRLIRSIETFNDYIKQRDIIEVYKEEADADLASVFKATYGKPIMLINATAQVALTHHLDDEVSQNASVNVNRQAASEKTLLPRDIKAAKEAANLISDLGKMMGTEPQMVNVLVADQVKKMTGIDVAPLLANNAVKEKSVTPTELGKELGISAQKINTELEKSGFQEKDEHGDWIATEKGKPFCTMNPYKAPKSDHTGYRVLWYRRILEELTKAA